VSILNLTAILLSLAAIFAWFNHRFIHLPTTIGVMLIALVFAVILSVGGKLGWMFAQNIAEIIADIDFSYVVLNGMLSFLLFAGALHVDLDQLADKKWLIFTLATVGVITSTALVGGVMNLLLGFIGLDVSLLYCLLFGALISPTDPIAVMATLKKVGVKKSLETKIAGESLFNDGVGVVVFLVLLSMVVGDDHQSVGAIALLFVEETGGGIIFGLALGALAYYLLKSIDSYQVEVLITLAVVLGGYALATSWHLSGPIAVVVAGLLIGNHGRSEAMSETTVAHVDKFWELVDEILNIVLFVLLGAEVILLSVQVEYFVAGLMAIVAVLLCRFISVWIPVKVFSLRAQFTPHLVKILTWGGLRGAISVSLALLLPSGAERDLFLTITYIIVVFSIVVQGLTFGAVVTRLTNEH
jgi:monovalent cation:H+ antiporter, CPA1 family